MSLVKQIEWFDSHFYKVTEDGKDPIYIPSVTTKLGAVAKPFLLKWYGDIGGREAHLQKTEAGDSGSRVHHAYHVFKTNGAVVYQPYQKPTYTFDELHALEKKYEGSIAVLNRQDEMYAVYKLQKLYDILKPVVMFSEVIVYSTATMNAGQVDDIWHLEAGEYKVNGREPLIIEESGLYINDLKTGNQVDDDSFMQTAAYLKLAEEMGIGEFKGTLLTHTNAKTKSGIEGLAVYLRSRPEVESDYSDFEKVAAIWQRKFSSMKPKCFEFPSLITQTKEKINANDTGTSQGVERKELEVR